MKRSIKAILTSLMAIIIVVVLVVPLGACGSSAIGSDESVVTKTFTDSSGRSVEVPENITKVAVSGPLAQIYVFALCPDKLVGLASGFGSEDLKYIDEKYADLTVLGQLYGSKGDLNKEQIMKTGAQVVIDVGEDKEGIAQDMDELQEATGIPFVHIFADTENTGEAYRMLGDLLNMPEEAEELASYCERIYQRTLDISNRVDKVSLAYLSGDLGLNVLAKGSYHSEIIDLLSNNVAELDDPSSKGTGNEIDMEQLMNWDPDVIIFAPQSIYSMVDEEKEWQTLKAIKNDRYYETPYGPYNWMGYPPSVQRYLGMMWLAQLLYPDEAQYDLEAEVREFYRLFIHCDLTEDQYTELVANSIGKRENQTW